MNGYERHFFDPVLARDNLGFYPTVSTVALILQCCVRLPSVTYALWLNGASYRKTV